MGHFPRGEGEASDHVRVDRGRAGRPQRARLHEASPRPSHTDACDVVGLMYSRGGESSVVSQRPGTPRVREHVAFLDLRSSSSPIG